MNPILEYVTIFDTSLATDNLGDEIIMEAIMREIRSFYPREFFVRIATHDRIGPKSREFAKKSEVSFVGGTNLLCANWFYRNQWKIGMNDFWRIGHPVLMGVGWHFYQRATDMPTAAMLRFLLSKQYMHSVRDKYTEKRLHDIGIKNVINTGCPTMWGLSETHCAKIPKQRAENALITVTGYRSDPETDREWIELVLSKYKNVYFWPQMHDDLEYIQKIIGNRAILLDASLHAYDNALDNFGVDFIGTRLHGGIRALQRKRRAVIIEVDNRATEIARDTGLPTLARGDTKALAHWINNPTKIEIRMPWENIAEWKAQFSKSDKQVAFNKPIAASIRQPDMNPRASLSAAV